MNLVLALVIMAVKVATSEAQSHRKKTLRKEIATMLHIGR
jgi:ribosomal protein L29